MAHKLTAKQEASLRIDYIPLDEIARFDKNPKKHDVGALVTSIRRYGFRDAPIFDGTLKALVAGHGRLKALEAMKGEGDKPPAGIIEHSAGQWLVPVQMGVDSKSAAEAKAFLIDHNTLTLSGGDLGVDSMLRLYDQAGLEELLKESGPTVSFDGEDIDALMGSFAVNDVALPELSGEDRAPFRQMTFTLHDNQHETVEAALAEAKKAGSGESGGPNENSNGNALAFLAAAFLTGGA